MPAPLDKVKALLAALPKEDQEELQRYLEDILVTEDEAESIQLASLEERQPGGRTVTYTYRQERVRCGKHGCWCAEGGLGHGPYTYKYWRDPESGKLRKEYLGKSPPPTAEQLSVTRPGGGSPGGRARGSSAASRNARASPA